MNNENYINIISENQLEDGSVSFGIEMDGITYNNFLIKANEEKITIEEYLSKIIQESVENKINGK